MDENDDFRDFKIIKLKNSYVFLFVVKKKSILCFLKIQQLGEASQRNYYKDNFLYFFSNLLFLE